MMITSAELNLYQNDFLWHINPYVRKAFYDRLMPHQLLVNALYMIMNCYI